MPHHHLFRPAVLVLLLPLLLVPAPAIASREDWVRAKTDFVEVLSDSSQTEATAFAVQYSAFRYVLLQMLGEPARKLPASTVILFRSERTFSRHFPARDREREVVSVSTKADGEPLLAQALDFGRENALRLAFEFETTWALPRMGYHVPLWAAQGTGKVFSTISLKRGVCTLGAFEYRATKAWEANPLAWPRFFEINVASEEYLPQPKTPSIYHSQAWAFMHWLWLTDERGSQRFRDLAAALPRLSESRAIESVTGVPEAEYSRHVSHHLRRPNRTRTFPFDEADLRSRLETGRPDPAVVAVRLAELLRSFGREMEAEQELEFAIATTPDHPLVREAMARRALRQHDRESAVNFYRQAIAGRTRNPHAYLISAEAWLDAAAANGTDRAGGAGENADKALADIRRALAIDVHDLNAYSILGRALYLSPNLASAQLDELAPGIALGDPTGAIRFYRALLHARLNNAEAYAAELQDLASARGVLPVVQRQAAERLQRLRN